MERAPRVFQMVGEPNGPTLWRTFQPCAELQRRGFFVHWRYKDDPESDTEAFQYLLRTRFDAVVLPRLSWTDYATGDAWIESLHAADVAVIYEMDDDFLSEAIVARQKATTERDKDWVRLEEERQSRLRVVQQCDGVTVSTRRLKTIVEQVVERPVVVVPNAIDIGYWRRMVRGPVRTTRGLTIGWCGGSRFAEDFEAMAVAWGRIARRYKHVRFYVQGHEARALKDAVPRGRLHVEPWTTIDDYPRKMRNVDIGCCAVAPKLFNTAKTPIKLWEFTLAGAVCVVSPTLYGEVTTDGVDALVAETADEWEAALARLVEDREQRLRLWKAQRRRVQADHALDKSWWRWLLAWERIVDDFQARQRRNRIILAEA